MEDRLMTIKQLAGYLNLNERIVLRLVTDGGLPGVKLGNQWRFRKAMIDTWLDDQMLGLTPRMIDEPKPVVSPRAMLELASCFDVSHILPEMKATTKNPAVEELAGFAADLGLVRDKTWFMGALIERENVLPSAMGRGVAFLHTMRRNSQQVVRPFMVLGRSKAGIDFDALDGKPTHLFFVLGLKMNEMHLPWLSKLSRMFATQKAVEPVLAARDAKAIYDVIAASERRLAKSG
ncbi:MAG: PTS sugar transporter subunit IIA [Deltaproteobacteria bacterium]|jgi:excisionase family DNA binding protein|nr:PTS sugar transporter subunit IIA [Deltaproteobacteria bacterium]